MNRSSLRSAPALAHPSSTTTRRALACFVACASLLAGCELQPYCLDCVDEPGLDAGPAGMDAGVDGGEPVGRDAALDASVPVDAPDLPDGCAFGAPELCNAFDDDCDGTVDEGIDLATDERHCGSCGSACAPPNAFGECVAGACTLTGCDVGYYDRDGRIDDGCEVRCITTEADERSCNRRDDDCDGTVDEGFDLAADPSNCGACGRICRSPHAASACSAGACALGACDPDWHDLDGRETNGCEYGCTAASPAVEACNLRDDDCDGRVDEGNPESGAACGLAEGECVAGVEQCVGGALTCVGGVSPATELCNGLDDDCDGTVDDGNPEGGRACGSLVGACRPGREVCSAGALVCEGAVAAVDESCNGIDDDCDGTIDDGNPGGGASCGSDVGECSAGVVACRGGGLACGGAVGPRLDLCNGLDDDCDGTADQAFDLLNDPRNCGACGTVCALPSAITGCASGACRFVACRSGFFDLDGTPGCEYACVTGGREACNGVDDDCDGRIDETVAAPAGVCNPNGVCASGTPTCTGTAGWTCTLPPTYEAVETRCDGLDNDCDGPTDEPFPLVGTACNNGALGACRRTGSYACTPAGTGVACSAPAVTMGTAETCNGIDDDCDSRLDESAPGTWTPFTASVGVTRYVMSFEASHPDGTATAAGTQTHRVCSESGRLPWTNVTPVQAAAACATVGARLCTEAEWQTACQTAAAPACNWSEADGTCTAYNTLCNTNEFDTNTGVALDQDAVLATGARAMCYASWGASRIYDLSGNVAEWTAARSVGVNPQRGGSTTSPQGGATCQFSFAVAADTIATPNVGFRCCRDTAP